MSNRGEWLYTADRSATVKAYFSVDLGGAGACYGGWFHFVGSLDRTGDFAPVDFGDGFTAWLSRRGAPALPALKDLPLVQLEFHATHVPWGISEPEAM